MDPRPRIEVSTRGHRRDSPQFTVTSVMAATLLTEHLFEPIARELPAIHKVPWHTAGVKLAAGLTGFLRRSRSHLLQSPQVLFRAVVREPRLPAYPPLRPILPLHPRQDRRPALEAVRPPEHLPAPPRPLQPHVGPVGDPRGLLLGVVAGHPEDYVGYQLVVGVEEGLRVGLERNPAVVAALEVGDGLSLSPPG